MYFYGGSGEIKQVIWLYLQNISPAILLGRNKLFVSYETSVWLRRISFDMLWFSEIGTYGEFLLEDL